MNKTTQMMATTLMAFGMITASSATYAGAPLSGPRKDNFIFSDMCPSMMNMGSPAPVAKAAGSSPVDMTASEFCNCVRNQVGQEAQAKIKCSTDFIPAT